MAILKNKEIYFPELSYKITGLFFKTHNNLGRFKSERQYCDFFENLLKQSSFDYSRETNIKKVFKDVEVDGNIPDFIIERKIIIDFKSKKFIDKNDYFQMLRYLESAKLPLGMIVNFRSTYLKPKRVINTKFESLE